MKTLDRLTPLEQTPNSRSDVAKNKKSPDLAKISGHLIAVLSEHVDPCSLKNTILYGPRNHAIEIAVGRSGFSGRIISNTRFAEKEQLMESGGLESHDVAHALARNVLGNLGVNLPPIITPADEALVEAFRSQNYRFYKDSDRLILSIKELKKAFSIDLKAFNEDNPDLYKDPEQAEKVLFKIYQTARILFSKMNKYDNKFFKKNQNGQTPTSQIDDFVNSWLLGKIKRPTIANFPGVQIDANMYNLSLSVGDLTTTNNRDHKMYEKEMTLIVDQLNRLIIEYDEI